MSKIKLDDDKEINTDFFEWLQLLFIALKLMGYINWSWWWVLSPMLIPLSVFLSMLAIRLIVLASEKS